MNMQLILVLVVCFIHAVTPVSHGCRNPRPYYNDYLDHQLAPLCPNGARGHNVAALYRLCHVPTTSSWRRGKQVNANCNTIATNAGIASFSAPGGNFDPTADHSAIFLDCLPDGSIRVADQRCGRRFTERILSKFCISNEPNIDCADNFYTIEW